MSAFVVKNYKFTYDINIMIYQIQANGKIIINIVTPLLSPGISIHLQSFLVLIQNFYVTENTK